MEKASKNFILNLKKQKRENKSLLFLDTVKIIKDAIENKTIKPECVLTSLDELDFEIDTQIYSVSQSVIEQLADTKTPQKVLCIAYYTQHMVQVPKENFLVLDGLQDPGNVGTLIRTAKASGFKSVFLIESVNVSNPKLIRSSVGAVLDGNVFEMTRKDFIVFAKKNKLNLVCCDMNGENIFKTDLERRVVGVVVGNEGQGVSEEIRSICYKTVKIPMESGIESLNAAVSGAIVMYKINKNKLS